MGRIIGSAATGMVTGHLSAAAGYGFWPMIGFVLLAVVPQAIGYIIDNSTREKI